MAYIGGWKGTQVLVDVYQTADWDTMQAVAMGAREDGSETDTNTETPYANPPTTTPRRS